MARVTNSNYRSIAAFRFEIRRYLAFSERAARAAGIEPKQHQLLLAVRGLPASMQPAIGVVAERLCLQYQAAVALIDKLEAHGLLRRERSTEDRRLVLLVLTEAGLEMLRRLSALHRDQLRQVGPAMVAALSTIIEESREESQLEALVADG